MFRSLLKNRDKKRRHKECRAALSRTLRVETLEPRNLLAVVFADEFLTTTFDPANWSVIEGATIQTLDEIAPSPPKAAHLTGLTDRGSRLESRLIDITGQETATIGFWFQRAGGSASPLSSEDLLLETTDSLGNWNLVHSLSGDGPATDHFVFREYVVPFDGAQEEFRFRFVNQSERSEQGDWLIDDVHVSTGTSILRGNSWHDENSNGEWDSGEPPLADWVVFIDDNADGILDQRERSARTADDGSYEFSGLQPGSYRVNQIRPPGWSATFPIGKSLDFIGALSFDDEPTTDLNGVRALAQTVDGQYLFAGGSRNGMITVLRKSTDGDVPEIIATYESDLAGTDDLPAVESIVVSPDSRYVYVASGASNQLLVLAWDFETERLTEASVIDGEELFAFPKALAMSRDGAFLYLGATNDASMTIFRRDAESGQLKFKERVDTGLGSVSEIVIGPQETGASGVDYLYVADSTGGALAVYTRDFVSGDLQLLQTLHDDDSSVDGLEGVFSIVVSPDGRDVYTAGSFDDAVAHFRHHQSTGQLSFVDQLVASDQRHSALDGVYSLAISSEGDRLFAASLTGNVLVSIRRDPDSGQLNSLEEFHNGQGPHDGFDEPRAVMLSADGSQLYVAGAKGNTLATFGAESAAWPIVLVNDQTIEQRDFANLRNVTIWAGAGEDDHWSTPKNWAGNLIPNSGDTIQFVGLEAVESINDLPEEISFEKLLIDDDDVHLSGEMISLSSELITELRTTGERAVIETPISLADGGQIVIEKGDLKLLADITSGEAIVTIDVADDAEFEFAGLLTSVLSIEKIGAGRMTISGQTEFAGPLVVQAGELRLAGNFETPLVTLTETSLLSGAGILTATVTALAGATIISGGGGFSIGSDTPDNDDPPDNGASDDDDPAEMIVDLSIDRLIMQPGSIFAPRIGTEDGVLVIVESAEIEGALLDAQLSTESDDFQITGKPITVMQNNRGLAAGLDTISGSFVELTQNSDYLLEDYQFKILYASGDGNDVTLTLVPLGEVIGHVVAYTRGSELPTGGPAEGETIAQAGVVLFVDYDRNGDHTINEPLAVTDLGGEYHFTDVRPGAFPIRQLLPEGWKQGTPSTEPILLAEQETIVDGVNGVESLDGVRRLVESADGRFVYAVTNNDDAVVVFSRDARTGHLTFLESHQDENDEIGLNGARYITISPDGRTVYVAGYNDNAITWFSRDEVSGLLTRENSVRSGAPSPGTSGPIVFGLRGVTALEFSPDGRFLYAAGFRDGAIAIFERDATAGGLTYVAAFQDGQQGVQWLAGLHGLAASPDGKQLFAVSTSDDALVVFDRDQSTGVLTFSQVLTEQLANVNVTSIARDVAVSSDGKSVFVAAELYSALIVYDRNPETGVMTLADIFQPLGALAGLGGAIDVELSSNGQFVFVVGASDEAVVMFQRNPIGGKLTYLKQLSASQTAGLAGARSTLVTADGQHLYIAGSAADAITIIVPQQRDDIAAVRAGRISSGVEFVNVAADTMPLLVAARSTGWSSDFSAIESLSETSGESFVAGGRPIPLSTTGVQTGKRSPADVTISQTEIDQIVVFFSAAATPEETDLTIVSDRGLAYAVSGFEFDADTRLATWTLDAPIVFDSVLVRLTAMMTVIEGDDQIETTVETTTEYRLEALAGDVNHDGVVAEDDLLVISSALDSVVGDPQYVTPADINGDGVIDVMDETAANEYLGNQLFDETPDTEEPLVFESLRLDGTVWTDEFRELIGASGNKTDESVSGFLFDLSAAETWDIFPWQGVDQIRLTLNRNVVIDPRALLVVGEDGSRHPAKRFTLDEVSHTATWTLAQPIAGDRIHFEIGSFAFDEFGEPFKLDISEQNAWSLSGGDGTQPIISQEIYVLPVDTDRDGTVTRNDFSTLLQNMFSQIGDDRFNPLADIDGNGVVNFIDLIFVRDLLRTRFIPIDPFAPRERDSRAQISGERIDAALSQSESVTIRLAKSALTPEIQPPPVEIPPAPIEQNIRLSRAQISGERIDAALLQSESAALRLAKSALSPEIQPPPVEPPPPPIEQNIRLSRGQLSIERFRDALSEAITTLDLTDPGLLAVRLGKSLR